MLILLSPSKKQSDIAVSNQFNSTSPSFIDKSLFLMNNLKLLSVDQLSKMMKISLAIAKNTHESIHQFSDEIKNNKLPAIQLFQGDAFQKLSAISLNQDDLLFAQNHLLIFSALYGYLRPFDVVSPYRLDMKDALPISGDANLYEYWKKCITDGLNTLLSNQKNKIILNLASDEYFKLIDLKKIAGKIIQVDFKVFKNKEYKTIGIYAKRGRGLLARYILQEKLDAPEDIINFKGEGFEYSASLSTLEHYVFVMNDCFMIKNTAP